MAESRQQPDPFARQEGAIKPPQPVPEKSEVVYEVTMTTDGCHCGHFYKEGEKVRTKDPLVKQTLERICAMRAEGKVMEEKGEHYGIDPLHGLTAKPTQVHRLG